MTAAERQAKKRTARLFTMARMRQSVQDARTALQSGDQDGIELALDQLTLLDMDLDDLGAEQ